MCSARLVVFWVLLQLNFQFVPKKEEEWKHDLTYPYPNSFHHIVALNTPHRPFFPSIATIEGRQSTIRHKTMIHIDAKYFRKPWTYFAHTQCFTSMPKTVCLSIIGEHPSISKSNRFHVSILRFFFFNVRYLLRIPLHDG